MEKNGRIVLTEKDLEAYRQGQVSERLQADWGLTYGELSEIINGANYVLNNESN